MLKKLLGGIVATLIGLLIWISFANKEVLMAVGHSETISEADVLVIHELIQTNMMRHWLGFLALERGSARGVVVLGLALIDNSSRANKELAVLANRLNVGLSPESVMPFLKMRMDPLRKASKGGAFDRAFIWEALSLATQPPPPERVSNPELKRILVKMRRMVEGDYLRVLKVGRDIGMSETELRY